MSAAAQTGQADGENRTLPSLLVTSAVHAPAAIAGNSINGVVSRIGTASRPHRLSVPSFIPLFSAYSAALSPVCLHFSTTLRRSPRLVYRLVTTSWQSSFVSIRTAYPPRALSPRLCSRYRLRLSHYGAANLVSFSYPRGRTPISYHRADQEGRADHWPAIGARHGILESSGHRNQWNPGMAAAKNALIWAMQAKPC